MLSCISSKARWTLPHSSKCRFAPLYHRRMHILFEKLDNERNYDGIEELMRAEPDAHVFCKFYMEQCGDIFTLNITVDKPELIN